MKTPVKPPAPSATPGVKPACVWTSLDTGIAAALAAVTLAVYWQVRGHEFITYDDPNYVTSNLRVQAGLTRGNLAWAFGTMSESNWHPLTWLSHMLDCQWFGLNAGAHHLMNVLFHAFNSLLLFGVFKRMTNARWPSAFLAALFALHPLHVESVAWVSERKDVLSTCFWLLTMGAYARYVERATPARYCLALALFALGLLSKPMVVTLPCVLLLLDFWPLQRIGWQGWLPSLAGPRGMAGKPADSKGGLPRLIIEKIPFLLLSAASCAATYAAQRGEAVVTMGSVPMAERVANAVISYFRYIAKTCWPDPLSAFYPYNHVWPGWQVAGAALLLAGLTALAFWGRREHRYLAVGWFWYLGTLVPVIGLVQVGAQAMADRYTYVPSIGLFVMVAWGAADVSKRWAWRKVVLIPAASVAIAACAMLTVFQTRLWKDSVTLFDHALRVTSDSAIGHLNLAYGLLAKGKSEEALVHFMAALKRVPYNDWAHCKVADILSDQGKLDEAVAQYSEALRLQPDFAEAHSGLAMALARQGKNSDALAHFNETLRLKPNVAEAHFRLGMFLAGLQRTAEAISQYKETLRLKPDSINALNNLAWILATHEDAGLRNGAEAVRLAERACQLTGERQAFFVGTLAAAYAEAGRFPEAVAAGQRAVAVALAGGQKELAASNQRLLELYRGGKPFHEKPVPAVPDAKPE